MPAQFKDAGLVDVRVEPKTMLLVDDIGLLSVAAGAATVGARLAAQSAARRGLPR